MTVISEALFYILISNLGQMGFKWLSIKICATRGIGIAEL